MRASPLLSVVAGFLFLFLTSTVHPGSDQFITADGSPPLAGNDGPYRIHRTTLLSPNVMDNDSDPDGDPIHFAGVGQLPAHGSLSFGPNGAISYAVFDSYVGPDSFTYRVSDGTNMSNFATVSIELVNETPVAANDGPYTVHGSISSFVPNVMANDSDGDNDQIFFAGVVQLPRHGSLSFGGNGDSMSYVADGDYVGPDSFTYRIRDEFGVLSSPATVTIDIVNTPPVAADDGAYIIRDTSLLSPRVMANDNDPDGDSITFAGVLDLPDHGTLNFSGGDAITYTAHGGYVGSDSFTYRVRDALGVYSNTATVNVTVLPGDGAENAGVTACKARVGEPVNITNGNLYLQQNDYQLPGVGEAIDITRTYNSISQRIGLFGKGWSTAHDEFIQIYGNTFVRWFAPDGQATNFTRANVGQPFVPVEQDFQGQLSQEATGEFLLLFTDGTSHRFSPTGRLASLTDRHNNTTTLTHGGSGILISVTDPFGRVLNVNSNAAGRVVAISDTMGTVATYNYGSSQQLVSVTYADNSQFQFNYDGSLRLTSVLDALGNVVEAHTYDAQGRAITSSKHGGVEIFTLNYISDTRTDVTDALGRVTKYTFDKSRGRNFVTSVEGLCSCGGSQTQAWTYDNDLNVTSHTDALNHTRTFTYDSNGNRLTESDSSGTIAYTYNAFGQVLTLTDQLNGVTRNTFDSSGNLLTTTDALNNTTSFTYDTRGQLLTLTNARGAVTTLTWDGSGRPTQIRDALNNITSFGYDARARLTSTTNALNFVTTFSYDAAGRLIRVTRPDNSFTTFTYDLAGRRTKETDALNNTTNFAYDGAYRVTSVINAALQSTTFGYDLMSNLISQTDPLGRTTTIEYDSFDRPVRTLYPAVVTGGVRLQETVTYDAAGNVVTRTDTAGRVTRFEYDDVDRLVRVIDPALQLTQYEYDARSNMTALIDAINQRYTFAYDALRRLTATTRAGMSMSFAYDAVGNRIQRSDYNNMVTNYIYDALNRLTNITYPNATTASYAYDQLSRLTAATNENGSINFVYDSLGQTTGATDVFGQVINYNYDANGRRTSLKFGALTNATYAYDVVNRLTKITDNSNQAVSYVYDGANRLLSRTLPNGIVTTYSYDALNRITRLRDAKGRKTIADNNYQYNNASVITQNIDAGGTHAYGYDAIDRLVSATYPGTQSETYAYDAVGNRSSSHQSASYSYQPFNRMVSTSTATYLYDNNGNMISKSDVSGSTQFAWDFENRLVQVVTPAGGSVTYKYDALGRRIQRMPSGGVSTNFVYDGQDVVRDINSDGTTIEYLNGPGIDNKIRQKGSSNATTYYFAHDHLGSTTALTNTKGQLVESLSYDAYGNSAGTTRTRYGFTGRERDPSTGLLYYRARWYDPELGRFISEDPIGLIGGINPFAYVGNNPVNAKDPSGLSDIDVHFYLTYYIAMKTGCFTHAEAWLIAAGNQDSDESPNKRLDGETPLVP